MDSLSEGDDDPEPEVFVDPLTIAAAREAQLSNLRVKEVQALIHVLVLAAQGHGAFAASDKSGDIFDELIQETNKSAAKTFFERGTNSSSKLTGCLITASDEAHAQLLISSAPKKKKGCEYSTRDGVLGPGSRRRRSVDSVCRRSPRTLPTVALPQ